MKKSLLSFMMCTIALCMMPQVSWATDLVTIQGNKVIVNSTSAGSLATYVNSLSETDKNALKVDEIVFIGKFNENDFQAVQGFPYKTVDMGEAKIVETSTSSTNYTFYHSSTPSGGSNGQKCVVGATKYLSNQTIEWQHVGDEQPSSSNIPTPYGWTAENINIDHLNEYNIGDYVKIPSAYTYYRKDFVWEEVNYPLIHEKNGDNDFNVDNPVWYAWTWSDATDGEWVEVGNGSNKKLKSNVIFVRMRYDAITLPSWDAEWNRTYDLVVPEGKVFVLTEWGNDGKMLGEWKGEPKTWTVDDLKANKANNVGDIVTINVNGTYKAYRYTGRMKWTPIEEDIALSESALYNKNIESPDWTDFDGTNYLDQLGEPLVYARFVASYTYYQKVAGSLEWLPSAYDDGAQSNNYYPDASAMPSPTEAYQQAFAGGTVYEYNNDQWTESGSIDNDTYDYSKMKFSYWSGTIEKAVTSKYADNTITGEIFQNCKKLTEVDYKAGNVTGFTDHKTADGYASGLKVTIGKNVTSIKDNAFLRCDALSTLVFDKDYSESNADKLDGVTYPLELTIGEGAFQNCTNLTGVEFPNRVVSIGNDAFKEAGTDVSEMAVSFERRSGDGIISFDRNLTIGQAAFQNCTTLKEIELPIRLSSMGEDAFKGTTSLTSVSIREDIEDARLTTIPSGAFENSGITSISIPRSVTEIKTHAFASCYDLETVWFQEQIVAEGQSQEPLIIRKEAFAGGAEGKYKLKDVWVDIDPQKRLLVCEYNAFHFEAIVGQTDVSSNQIATLHFSENYWDYYAGKWKKGLAFSQASLNSFKDGFNEKRGNQQPTVDSQGLVEELQPANGWQQFALSSTGIEIELPEGKFVRSYSVSQPCEIPQLVTSNGRTPFVKIYRVTDFSDGWTSDYAIDDKEAATNATRKATATEVTGYIPMETGLLMVGLGDANQSYLLYPAYLKKETYNITYPYEPDTSKENVNLLEPTCDEIVTINPTIPYPFRSKSEITHRLFGFKANKVTNDGGVFLRSQPGVQMKPNQAYLKLPVSMFHWGNEAGDNGSGLSDSAGAKDIILEFATDILEDGVATAITNSTTSADRQASTGFYTLQGQRTERPTAKGIYIYNGKKIMVK